jgi:hypothetical protein
MDLKHLIFIAQEGEEHVNVILVEGIKEQLTVPPHHYHSTHPSLKWGF